MIDRATFTREMGLIHDRFGRSVSGPVVQRYYETLSEHLSTEEFVQAARVIFDQDKFWPPPMRFVEAVRGTPKQRAMAAWERVLTACSSGDHERITNLPADDWAALRAIGGFTRVAYAEGAFAQSELRRAFLTAYEEALTGTSTPALPAPASAALEIEA